jgi:predicted dehydrogenase
MEAFMFRYHPQWQAAHALVADDAIGAVRAVQTSFFYFNDDPRNVRNVKAAGGGALLDIGCYGVAVARYLFGREPRRAAATWDLDPRFGTDRLVSAVLDFGDAVASFTCGTQMARQQRVEIVGARGVIEIATPFNAPADQPSSLLLRRGTAAETRTVDAANQYERQADAFAAAMSGDRSAAIPLADSVANMRAIDAVRESADHADWVQVATC